MTRKGDSPLPELYYDNSCGLCRTEIRHLAPRLEGKVRLVDISEPGFEGAHGVDKNAMLQRIHLWQEGAFVTGFEATLLYWQKAGLAPLVWCFRLPGVRHLAHWAYDLWARKRAERLGYCEVGRSG
ncbi:MAG: thiol-disulfide oxidoreductase DCC family protein [Saccharospirillum sp.]